jgi:hypothetical protein
LWLASLFHLDVVATLFGMRSDKGLRKIRRVRLGRAVRGVSGSHLEIHPALAHGLCTNGA